MSESLEANFLFKMEAQLDTPIPINGAPQGSRLIIGVPGGSFEGPKLKGTLIGGPGSEWATAREDGSMKADVKLLLETDDGAHILMQYQGIVSTENEKTKVRTAPLFETGDSRYSWLNRVQAVGLGKLTKTGIVYDVYEIL